MADPAPAAPAAEPLAGGAPPAPAPAAPTPAAPAGTILDPPNPATPPAPAPAPGAPEALPEKWREIMATGTDGVLDEKKLAQFKRFLTPGAIAEHLLTERQRISKGNVLPDKATPEQLAEYRKENGIPEKPEGYLEKLPADLKFTNAEKPLIDKFAAALHGQNAKPEVVHAALSAYNEVRVEAEQQRIALNETKKAEGIATLKQEWGADNDRNLNVIGNVLRSMPEDAQTALATARGPDGVMLFNNPAVLKALAQMGLDINPAYSVLPGSADPVKGMATEIETIEKTIRDEPDKYWNGAAGAAMQNRYRELLGARERMPKT